MPWTLARDFPVNTCVSVVLNTLRISTFHSSSHLPTEHSSSYSWRSCHSLNLCQGLSRPSWLPKATISHGVQCSSSQPASPRAQRSTICGVEPATSLSNCLMMSSIPARTQRDVLNNHKELVPHPHLSHGLVCNIPWTGLPDRTPTSPRCLLFPSLPEATKCCRPQDIILERALLPSRGDQPSIAKNIYHKRRRIRDACLIPRTYPTTPPFPRILLLTTTTAGARRQRRKPSFGIAPGERAREPMRP